MLGASTALGFGAWVRGRHVAPVLCAAMAVFGCSSGDAAGGGASSPPASSGGGASSSASVGGRGGASVTVAGAGGSDASGGRGGALPFTPGPHGAAPYVNTELGPVLTTPKLQLIAYAGDPVTPDVEAFLAETIAMGTLAAQTEEYGVGAFTLPPTLQIPGPAPASLNDSSGSPTPFQQALAANLSGTSPAWGPADAETIYMFLLPLGTSISASGQCCSSFLGYHGDAAVGAVHVPYAVVCDCPAIPGDQLTPLEYVTTTVSHEMVEAATDPLSARPAYVVTDVPHFVWTLATGGELADMCQYNYDANYRPPGATYMLQRSWSNKAGAAGTNPCVPVPDTGPYFNSVPVLTDPVDIQYFGLVLHSQGVTIPVGGTKTIDVQLWSEAETRAPWKVTAYDLSDYLGTPRNLELALDRDTGSNGDTLHLTVKVDSQDPRFGIEGFVLVSDLGDQENLSVGLIGN